MLTPRFLLCGAFFIIEVFIVLDLCVRLFTLPCKMIMGCFQNYYKYIFYPHCVLCLCELRLKNKVFLSSLQFRNVRGDGYWNSIHVLLEKWRWKMVDSIQNIRFGPKTVTGVQERKLESYPDSAVILLFIYWHAQVGGHWRLV